MRKLANLLYYKIFRYYDAGTNGFNSRSYTIIGLSVLVWMNLLSIMIFILKLVGKIKLTSYLSVDPKFAGTYLIAVYVVIWLLLNFVIFRKSTHRMIVSNGEHFSRRKNILYGILTVLYIVISVVLVCVMLVFAHNWSVAEGILKN